MSPRRNWDSPNPSLASECAPPPKTWGGHTRLGGGGRGPNSDDWRKSLALCLLGADSTAVKTQLCGWSLDPPVIRYWFPDIIVWVMWSGWSFATTIPWLILGFDHDLAHGRPHTECCDSICDSFEYNEINHKSFIWINTTHVRMFVGSVWNLNGRGIANAILSITGSMDEWTLKTPIPSVIFIGNFLGWWSNFVNSESDKIQSVKILQNMDYNTTHHLPSPTATHCL